MYKHGIILDCGRFLKSAVGVLFIVYDMITVCFVFPAKKHFGTFPRGFESTSHPPTVDGPGELGKIVLLFCDSVRNGFCGSVSQKLLFCGSVGQKLLFCLLCLSDSDKEQFLWLRESKN